MIRIRHIQRAQQAVTALLFASYLLVLAMAASPALHQWLHDDADESDHQCAVVAAIHGQIDRPIADTAIVASTELSWVEPRPALYAVAIERLFLSIQGLEHAPPVIG